MEGLIFASSSCNRLFYYSAIQNTVEANPLLLILWFLLSLQEEIHRPIPCVMTRQKLYDSVLSPPTFLPHPHLNSKKLLAPRFLRSQTLTMIFNIRSFILFNNNLPYPALLASLFE